jgi:hypothetical protein
MLGTYGEEADLPLGYRGPEYIRNGATMFYFCDDSAWKEVTSFQWNAENPYWYKAVGEFKSTVGTTRMGQWGIVRQDHVIVGWLANDWFQSKFLCNLALGYMIYPKTIGPWCQNGMAHGSNVNVAQRISDFFGGRNIVAIPAVAMDGPITNEIEPFSCTIFLEGNNLKIQEHYQ